MKTFIIAVILVGGLSIGGYYYWQHTQALAKAAAEPKVTTAKVESGPIKQSVQATGTMSSNLDVDIKCKAGGEVIKLPFDISNEVKKGDLLVELDPIDEQPPKDLADAALASSTAKLASARQNLKVSEMQLVTDRGRAEDAVKSTIATADRAKLKMDRLKGAVAENAATQEEVDQSIADYNVAMANADLARVQTEELKREEAMLELRRQEVKLAEAQVKADEVNLSLAKLHLDECRVYAPMDGVISTRPIQIGTIISSAISNVGGGTTVLTISDLSRMFSLATVDESDIGSVALGQKVNVTADSHPGMKFNGKVTRIAIKGVNVSNVVTFEVQIEILDPKKRLLKPQMTTNVEIIAAEKESTLVVPVDAVSRKKAEKFVTVQKPDGTTEERPVQTGIVSTDKTEIVSGVSEGEVVVLRKTGNDKWSGGNRPPTFNPLTGGAPKGR